MVERPAAAATATLSTASRRWCSDVLRGYYDRNDAADEYGVVLTADAAVDVAATERRRALGNSALRRPLRP